MQKGFQAIHFRLKYCTRMRDLRGSYSKKVAVSAHKLMFFYRGTVVGDDATPESLEMGSKEETLKVCKVQPLGSANESHPIRLRVVDPASGYEVQILVKVSQELGDLMRSYVQKMDIDYPVRFYFDAMRICDRDTSKLLGMTQGNVIEVARVLVG